ncbi:MAG: hypothetical protein KGL95_13595 [Patescibacteria group bacterium]|nr:hypothetical protein [Patescibacteria group bacterium]
MAVNSFYVMREQLRGHIVGNIVEGAFHHSPIKYFKTASELLELAKKQGRAIPDLLRGKRNLREVIHSQDNFLAEYRAMATPGPRQNFVTGRMENMSEITQFEQLSAYLTINRLAHHDTLKDLVPLGSYLNRLVQNPNALSPRKEKNRAKALNALREFWEARSVFVEGVVNDSTLAIAKRYYEEIEHFHPHSFFQELSRLGIGAAVSVVATALLAPVGPLAPFGGAFVGRMAEKAHHKHEAVPIMTEDGTGFEKIPFTFKDPKALAQAVGNLADKADALLSLINLPSVDEFGNPVDWQLVRQKNKSSRVSTVRAWELGNAIIATYPDYFRLAYRFQAYNILLYRLQQEEQAAAQTKK